MVSFVNITYMICFLISLVLSFVIGTQRRKSSNRFFAITLWAMSFWIFSNFMVSNSGSLGTVLFWIRTAMIGPVLIGPFFLVFSIVFPEEKKISFKKLLLLVLPSLPFFPLIYTKYNVQDVLPSSHPGQSVTFTPGVLYVGLGLFLMVYILCSVFILINKYKNATDRIIKNQIRFVLFGFIVTFLISLMGTLVLPLLNYTKLGVIGPLSTMLFSAITFFVIYKYKFLDIRLLVGKLVYFILVAIPPYFTYFALAFVYESLFDTSFNTVAYMVGIPVAIAFTAFLNFFTKFISEYTDTHLINPGYNPLVVLEKHRQRLSNTLDIDKIIQESLFIIARTIRPSSSGAILISRNKGERWMSINYKKAPYESPEEFKIFTEYFFNHSEKVISYDQLINHDDENNPRFIQNQHLASQMEKKELGVIVVLKEEATIRGLLLIGKKEATEPYNKQELKLLESIADSMGLALGRALLYEETQQFNEELKQRINDATSALQKQNKDLETALTQLEEVRRQEKDMLDVMGHELRTPVSIARNALLSMRKHLHNHETPDPEKLKRFTRMAIEGTRREIALVETLLSTTKLEGNRMEVNLIPVSLMRVVEYTLRSHTDLAEKNKTEIIYNKPEKDTIVLADKVRIQEIMDNFLNNAIKYTGEGKVEITIYEKEGLGWVDVKDTGIGISEENLKHLGKKFFRAQNLYNKSKNVVNPSGTGLGLFVSFLLIDIMKGQKKIISKEGEGSTFGFGIPIYSGPLQVEEESQEEKEVTNGNPGLSSNAEDNVEAETAQTEPKLSQPEMQSGQGGVASEIGESKQEGNVNQPSQELNNPEYLQIEDKQTTQEPTENPEKQNF